MYHRYLNFCLILCDIVGVPPNKHSIFRKLHYAFTTTSIFTVTGLTVYLIYWNGDYTIQKILEVSTTLTMFPHAWLKLTTIFIKKRQIFELFETTRSGFWEIQETPEIKRLFKKADLCKNAFFYTVVFFLVSTIIKPFLGELAYKCYEPEWAPKFLQMLLQDYACCCVLLGFCAYDMTIQSFLVLTKVQFMMLNNNLRDLFTFPKGQKGNKDEIYRRLKKCVEHQIYLIEFVESFKATFSATNFLYIGNIILSLCMRAYIVGSDDSSFDQKFEAVVHTLAGLNQICFCYSIPAQLLMNEANDVSNNVYFSLWYEYPEYAKDILFILKRDQRELRITAGGLIIIDLKMFLVACKTIVSYTMFLNTMTQLQ